MTRARQPRHAAFGGRLIREINLIHFPEQRCNFPEQRRNYEVFWSEMKEKRAFERLNFFLSFSLVVAAGALPLRAHTHTGTGGTPTSWKECFE